ncbi:MAG: chemotaxis protein CheD [Firmicutes bacterium]|jgi:chemotaxis protein CheD|nr:chemotaxis protein CheD [Bacillota bacterium]
MAPEVVAVGIGEIKVSARHDVTLVAYGLGSCIGVVVWDPDRRVGGLAHVVLPDSSIGLGRDGVSQPERFADTGIPLLLQAVERLGALRQSLRAKIAGGAKMFVTPTASDVLDIGGRNAKAVKEALAEAQVPLVAEDIGGTVGRTMRFIPGQGRVFVRTLGMKEREL